MKKKGANNINHAIIHIPSWVELQIEFNIKVPTLHTPFCLQALDLSSQRCDIRQSGIKSVLEQVPWNLDGQGDPCIPHCRPSFTR